MDELHLKLDPHCPLQSCLSLLCKRGTKYEQTNKEMIDAILHLPGDGWRGIYCFRPVPQLPSVKFNALWRSLELTLHAYAESLTQGELLLSQ